MDFASLMSTSINKSKGAPSTTKGESPSSHAKGGDTSEPQQLPKKYLNRREAEEQRRLAYLAEQKELEEKRLARAAEKRKYEEEVAEDSKRRGEKRRKLAEESRARRQEQAVEEEKARRTRLGLPELPPVKDGENTDGGGADSIDEDDDEVDSDGRRMTDLTDKELAEKFRSIGEPVSLFGEERVARVKRYRRLTTTRTDALSAGPISTTLAPVEEKNMKVDVKVPPASDRSARKWLFRQLASYFNMVLQEWQRALSIEHQQQKADGVGTMSTGTRQAVSTLQQCINTMKPLFRKFETQDLADDLLAPIVEIVRAAQERRYVDANDGYLRLSIGKAAWPIGVTMVGIHERSAREKLHDGSEKGHVMGDEVTRKFLQSIKRCLTFAQVRWPPEDIRQLMG